MKNIKLNKEIITAAKAKYIQESMTEKRVIECEEKEMMILQDIGNTVEQMIKSGRIRRFMAQFHKTLNEKYLYHVESEDINIDLEYSNIENIIKELEGLGYLCYCGFEASDMDVYKILVQW